MKKFRPVTLSKIFRIKTGPSAQWNWVKRRFIPDSILRIASRLHYLGSHAPLPVMKKWKRAEKKFFKRYKNLL